MERSRSVPVTGNSGLAVNPFHSNRVQEAYILDASRPMDLPRSPVDPIQDVPGEAAQFQVLGPTGKGRGSSSAGVVDEREPRSTGSQAMRTEGQLSAVESERTMGPVNGPSGNRERETGMDELQRALEGEVVTFLRQQNSKLMDELADLKARLDRGSVGKSSSGMETSPWSAVGGSNSTQGSNGFVGTMPPERPGRHGSRTPRSRIRETAVSPERQSASRFTPNGTKVPDGPPPESVLPLPPVPPFPIVPDAAQLGDGSSFVSGLYDTCESKPRVKNCDIQWKPQNAKGDGRDVLSPSEAKQVWLEREVRSLKTALDRVSIPQALQQSEYWNAGFEGKVSQSCFDPSAHDQLHRASASAPQVPGGVRAAYEHGEHFDRDRALHEHGDLYGQVRALNAALGEHLGQDRARMAGLGDPREQARALASVHGDLYGRDRAQHAVLGELCAQDRAPRPMAGMESTWGLHDTGPANPCHLPGHDLGGGGVGDVKMGRHLEPWPEANAGQMNTKGELPELPANSTPLQFGDWLHLIAPVMKDVSGVAGWWWETTLREAKAFYETWKNSSPLQRIQIAPQLPDALREQRFQRTEQRGIQMLLKSIPEAEQQALVTDRALSTTAILYKLLVRFQPGGAGEKQLLLSQLTSIPTSKSIHELAAAIRNWRRHFGRAQEVQAVLPDGVLLLKALDVPLQHLASLDPQAAFRLAQSRMQLQLDEKPVHTNLWAFSQCLLAEAETLCLLTTSPATTVPSSPLKLKPMDAMATSTPKKLAGDSGNVNGKGKGATMDAPCKWFKSDTGCRAGRNCKWSHSWEGVTDKNERCWICGSKEHRKNDCKVKGGGGKRQDEPKGSGGGNGATSKASSSSNPSTTLSSSTSMKPQVNEMSANGSSSTTTTSSETKSGSAAEEGVKGSGDGGTGGDQASKATKADDLLHEATQLLKSLQVKPKIKVMLHLTGLDQAEENLVLLDSGATHALRPACDADEWGKAERTTVQLAEGMTDAFRLKPGTRILLSRPGELASKILPMSGLSDLDFVLEWKDGVCRLHDVDGREIPVVLRNGCPMVEERQGDQLLQWFEAFQIHQKRKLAIVRTLLRDEDQIDKESLDLELALTVRLRQLFPQLPDEIMARLVPHLEMVKTESFGSKLPWNRRKRRRLMKAKNIVIHCFSGPDKGFWDKSCSDANTEILCVDTLGSNPASLHDKFVYGFLLMLCASGKVRSIIGGPPCRTVSALRYQSDNGPGILRSDEHPYGLPDLSPGDMELVLGDSVLMLRFWSLLVMAEEVRDAALPVTQFMMEQPEDPARYRNAQDVEDHKYFSIYRTPEWSQFAAEYGLRQVHFDQFPMGHIKRKPTTLATSDDAMEELQNLRGGPSDETAAAARYRAMSIQQRCEESKSWSSWAPGLKAAMAKAIKDYVLRVEGALLSLPSRALNPAGDTPGRDPDLLPQRALRSLSRQALESWKTHFLCDHMPSRRDCVHCVRSQGRGKSHRRVTHPDAFTLSVDLSGKMTAGYDQGHQRCRYMLVACYTFPVTNDGTPLIDPPGQGLDHDKDHPLPQPGEVIDDDVVWADEDGDDVPMPEAAADVAEPEDPLHEQSPPQDEADGPAQESVRTAFDVWHKLIEEATDVGVKNLTFVEVLNSRSVKDVLPALARIYARLHALGLPLMRIHCDRARELTSAPVRRWTLDRGIITTLTTGSSFKANGRVEAEVGATKRAVRTLISAKLCPLEHWPLAARHIGERRLRYTQWRDVREAVIVMGPDKFSSLTTTSYYVRSLSTGKFFYTDDVVQPPSDAPLALPDDQPTIYLEERGENSLPPPWPEIPRRRLRGKTTLPAPVVRSMNLIEGEMLASIGGGVGATLIGTSGASSMPMMPPSGSSASSLPMMPQSGSGSSSQALPGAEVCQGSQVLQRFEVSQDAQDLPGSQVPQGPQECQGAQEPQLLSQGPMVFQYDVPAALQQFFDLEDVDGSDEESWSIATDSDNTTAASQATTPSCRSDVEEESGGGGKAEAPNNREGGSCPVASLMTGQAALRQLHQNISEYIQLEMQKLDAASSEQSLWLPAVTEALNEKASLERQLRQMQCLDEQEAEKHLEQEFLVTRTVGNSEVWNDLSAWEPSIRKEFDELVVRKQAVQQVTKKELQRLSAEKGVPIELLPAKMVFTRKSGSGAYRSRAVVCGNYANPDNLEHYAGGAGGDQIRSALRLGALKSWSAGSTDIRTAFLNAPRQDGTRLVAMEIPLVFKRLGLASADEVWVIQKALYGLSTSPRDWCLHRNATLPSMCWTRSWQDRSVTGCFVRTADENMWRIQETDQDGTVRWVGLMLVYVDDLLFVAEPDVISTATQAIAETWALSEIEIADEGRSIKYCGFEIESAPGRNGFVISQQKYEAEMIQRFNIEQSAQFPNFRVAEGDEEPEIPVTAQDIKQAQSMAGALLWLATRTRPDIAFGVSVACKLATKNPVKSIEVATAVMKYVKGNPGALHYPADVPTETWGPRNQLKVERHPKLLEVFADIAYAAGGRHRSLQGIVVFFAGAPVAWLSSQQAFVTYSTAEAELVSYCEALNAGRSFEAILCSMLNEPLGNSGLERIIYGDNLSAISLAHGTGTASWRTRHLRVRSSFLKEALDGIAPGGLWRLLHLRGTELVADGLTKPLLGQAFGRFLQDLGIRAEIDASAVDEPQETSSTTPTSGGGVQNQAAVRALVAGSILMSQVHGMDEIDGEVNGTLETDWVFLAAGACLMTLGAIQVGQMVHDLTKCCLRRLRTSRNERHYPAGHVQQAESSDEDSVIVLSDNEASRSLERSTGGPTSKKTMRQSGSRSGASLKRMTSSSATKTKKEVERSAQDVVTSTSASSSVSDSCTMGAATSSSLRQQSGSQDGELDFSLTLRRRSGSGTTCAAAGDPAAAERSAVAAAESGEGALVGSGVGSVSKGKGSKGGLKEADISNPWNRFQHEYKGKGLSSTSISKLYHQRHQ
eukprot:s1755_g3.t1